MGFSLEEAFKYNCCSDWGGNVKLLIVHEENNYEGDFEVMKVSKFLFNVELPPKYAHFKSISSWG